MLNYVKSSKMSTQATLVHTREDATSPIKKKFRESSTAISRAELDGAILAGVKQALSEQQTDLDRIVTVAIKSAIDDVLTPQILDLKREIENTNKAVTAVTGQIEQMGKSVSLLQSRYDTIQAAVRKDRDQISHLESKFDDITLKIADMEDRSRRSNVRLVGLREGVEGDDCIAFLKANLPKWIPSIATREIKIERAHRIYSDKQSKRPCTVIFKLLDYTDRQAVLKGARAAYPVKFGSETLHFFPDYSADTTKKRKAFTEVRKKMDTLGIQLFLLFPATLKVIHAGRQNLFRSPLEAEQYLLSSRPGNDIAIASVGLPPQLDRCADMDMEQSATQ